METRSIQPPVIGRAPCWFAWSTAFQISTAVAAPVNFGGIAASTSAKWRSSSAGEGSSVSGNRGFGRSGSGEAASGAEPVVCGLGRSPVGEGSDASVPRDSALAGASGSIAVGGGGSVAVGGGGGGPALLLGVLVGCSATPVGTGAALAIGVDDAGAALSGEDAGGAIDPAGDVVGLVSPLVGETGSGLGGATPAILAPAPTGPSAALEGGTREGEPTGSRLLPASPVRGGKGVVDGRGEVGAEPVGCSGAAVREGEPCGGMVEPDGELGVEPGRGTASRP